MRECGVFSYLAAGVAGDAATGVRSIDELAELTVGHAGLRGFVGGFGGEHLGNRVGIERLVLSQPDLGLRLAHRCFRLLLCRTSLVALLPVEPEGVVFPAQKQVAATTAWYGIPVSLSIDGFTKMMYAIVMNVVTPARISVRQLVPRRSNSK